MQLKLYKRVLILTIILVIIATIAAIYYNMTLPPAEEENVVLNYDYEYLLKSVSGEVCVFQRGNNEPIETLDVYLDSLPVADRMDLINGIKLKDDEELARVIEDFES